MKGIKKMKQLDKIQQKLLDTLCDMEAKNINEMYDIGTAHGDIAFKMAYNSFESYLLERDGEFIHAMHTEWRYFLVQLLKNIEEKNIEYIMKLLFHQEDDNFMMECDICLRKLNYNNWEVLHASCLNKGETNGHIHLCEACYVSRFGGLKNITLNKNRKYKS